MVGPNDMCDSCNGDSQAVAVFFFDPDAYKIYLNLSNLIEARVTIFGGAKLLIIWSIVANFKSMSRQFDVPFDFT